MKLEKHLFVSDFHIPDHNPNALKALLKFIRDSKPDQIHILGDFLNFTKASDYLVVGTCPSLWEEIKIGRAILYDIVTTARKANKKVKIEWYCGNHEYRLEKYLASGDNVLSDIEEESGELLVSIGHIFNLKKLGIEWIPYFEYRVIGNMILEHGMNVRAKAGFTAHAQIEKYGKPGASGHTHRLSLVFKNQGGEIKWWLETGCMCNLQPSPAYVKSPDWENGFCTGVFDSVKNIMYPSLVPLIGDRFVVDGKIYSG